MLSATAVLVMYIYMYIVDPTKYLRVTSGFSCETSDKYIYFWFNVPQTNEFIFHIDICHFIRILYIYIYCIILKSPFYNFTRTIILRAHLTGPRIQRIGNQGRRRTSELMNRITMLCTMNSIIFIPFQIFNQN